MTVKYYLYFLSCTNGHGKINLFLGKSKWIRKNVITIFNLFPLAHNYTLAKVSLQITMPNFYFIISSHEICLNFIFNHCQDSKTISHSTYKSASDFY